MRLLILSDLHHEVWGETPLGTYRQTSDHCRQVNCTPPPHKLDGAAT